LGRSLDLEFDAIVAGAGSAGCVLASRLTDNPSISLCLIEAGGRDRNPWIHVPLGFGKLVPNRSVNWGYETEPEPKLNGRRISWPRGKVLGGSGSINGLVFLRGDPSDYDGWEALGARAGPIRTCCRISSGWSTTSLAPMNFAARADRWSSPTSENPAEPVPDLQFQCFNFSTEHLTLGLDRWPGFGFSFCVCRPKSRGEIRLADPSGRSMPRIFANYFSDDDDMQRTVAAFHIGRPIIATEPYRALIFAEVRPAAHVNDEEQIRPTFGRLREPSTIRAARAGWARTSARSSTVTCA
jgi:choline dehydrogenase-like flavoprotein